MENKVIGDVLKQRADTDKSFLIDPATEEELSYSRLAYETDRLIEKLRAMGFKSRDKVAVALPNGITAGIVILGIMSAGGVVVPINLGWREKEFTYILENSESDFLISNNEIITQAGVHIEAKALESYRDAEIMRLSELGGTDTDAEKIRADDLALMLYTSGTTGKPKGVMLTHSNLLAETSYIVKGHELTEEDRALQVLPLFHINGLVIGFLSPFVTGMTLVIPKKFSVSHFWEWIERYKVTWLSAVPTIISMVLARTPTEYKGAESLKFLRSASAALPAAVLEEFESRFNIPIVESFGISEGGSQITTNPVHGTRKVGSVGRAVGNVVEVVDENGNALDFGETGEVRIKGANIFKGYFKNEAETSKSLREGWFYTGDLGRLDEEGYLFLSGRKKELINRAGEKFSPREIDEILYQIHGVELAAAVGVPDPLYNEEVVAYIKLRDGVELTEEQIIKECQGKLADFKIPKEIFFTDDFPKGPSGKIQRLKFIERYEAQKRRV
jgi:acyl-CoA synthetase (AMP-forming)/AMP-acid ligase II